LWGSPVSMRVGRQELAFGSQWLMGVNDKSSLFTGLSFDALRLTFANDVVTVDAIAAKLAESLGDFGDDDVDLYGLYGSYLGIEDVVIDAYWLFIHDDQGAIAGFINGGDVDLHTLGLRGAGVVGAFDFELEVAYQFGDVDDVPNPWFRLFDREADVDYDEFGANLKVGYTFDCAWQPRVFAVVAYLGGGDPDESRWNNDRDLPFNRLFSNTNYCDFLDMQQNMSNMLVYKLGVQVRPTECLDVMLGVVYLVSDEDAGSRGCCLCRDNGDSDIGLGAGLHAAYHYSEDLVMRAGYSICLPEDGFERNAGPLNGLAQWGGDDNDECHYLFVETEICF
ncbi:MAG: alginate export family protein, partial [Candidatus Hydrogenedentes bacterium]|nr:alginate export family protein [Candidatus Hydrogenedentota bacterium]